MRPIRNTGAVGNGVTIPLDVYNIQPASAIIESAAPATQQLQYTLDDVFNPPAGGITWTNTATSGLNAALQLPAGARAVRGTNLVAADVVVVSQSSIT